MINLLDQNPLLKYLPRNESGKDYVVGDIHGCLHLLEILLDEVDFDETVDRLISVGDLVDRGRYSMQCLKLMEKPWFHAVMGNHEDLLRGSIIKFMMQNNFYEGPVLDSVAVRSYAGTHQQNGGEWIEKYFIEKGDFEEKKAFCIDYLKRLNEMPLVMIVGAEKPADRYHVVHSEIYVPFDAVTDEMIDSGELLNRQGLIWERNLFVYGKADVLKWPENYQSPRMSDIYCGHTPVREITRVASQINVDTCAFYADFISADRNGTNGLTFINPINKDWWTVNGATKEITRSNLDNPLQNPVGYWDA